jgi:hypothetical protein
MMIRTAWGNGLVKKGRKVRINEDKFKYIKTITGTVQCVHDERFYIAIKTPTGADGWACETHGGEGRRQWVVYACSENEIEFLNDAEDPVIEEI